MHLLFITGESLRAQAGTATPCANWAKGLRSLGHRITLVSPSPEGFDPTREALARRLTRIVVNVGGADFSYDIYAGKGPAGIDRVVLDCESASIDDVNGTDVLSLTAVSAFARAAARYASTDVNVVDAVIGFGRVGALALARLELDAASLTSARVLAVSGESDAAAFPIALDNVLGLENAGRDGLRVSPLRAGVLAADRIVMPSLGLGRRIAAQENALGAAVASASERIHASLPGIDAAAFNPLTDVSLASRFDPVDRSGKARCRSALARELGLASAPDAASVCLLVDEHTSMQTVGEVVRALLRTDASVSVGALGNTDVSSLDSLASRWADRLAVKNDIDDALLHRFLGSSDIVVPLVAEPARDALALAAMRYGSLPVVAMGSIAGDVVVDADPKLASGTGFIADAIDAEGLIAALRRAVASFGTHRDAFDAMAQRTMRVDVSLDRSARMVERVVRLAITSRAPIEDAQQL
jgi:hypothetical protein